MGNYFPLADIMMQAAQYRGAQDAKARQDMLDQAALDHQREQTKLGWANYNAQTKAEEDKRRFDISQQQAKDAEKQALRVANQRRYVAQGMERGSLDPMAAAEFLRQNNAAEGLTLPDAPEYQGNGQEGQQIIRQNLIQQLQGASSAQLGAPEYAQQDKVPYDEFAIQVQRGYGLNPDSQEGRAKYLELRNQAQDAANSKDASARQEKANDATISLRKEFQSQQTAKDTMAMASAFEKIRTASENAAGDMGLVFGYMKILDPNSSVREGEYANASNTTGVPGYILNMYNKAKDGQILTPEQRASFKSEAGKLFAAQRGRYDAMAKQYADLARQTGADPGAVVLDYGLTDLVNNGRPRDKIDEIYDQNIGGQ